MSWHRQIFQRAACILKDNTYFIATNAPFSSVFIPLPHKTHLIKPFIKQLCRKSNFSFSQELNKFRVQLTGKEILVQSQFINSKSIDGIKLDQQTEYVVRDNQSGALCLRKQFSEGTEVYGVILFGRVGGKEVKQMRNNVKDFLDSLCFKAVQGNLIWYKVRKFPPDGEEQNQMIVLILLLISLIVQQHAQQRQYQMATIRSYIRQNQEFIRERDRYTARPNYTNALPRKNNHTALSHSVRSHLAPISVMKKKSLPPIQECTPKNQLFSLQLKRSQQLSKYFQSKNQALVSNRNIRSKTEPNDKQSSSRTHFALNLSEVRMRPLDKYFYRMENIRLAERLLVVKPSPEIRRPHLKQFFKKQKHYGNQISHNSRPRTKMDKKMKSKLTQLQKQWIN